MLRVPDFSLSPNKDIGKEKKKEKTKVGQKGITSGAKKKQPKVFVVEPSPHEVVIEPLPESSESVIRPEVLEAEVALKKYSDRAGSKTDSQLIDSSLPSISLEELGDSEQDIYTL